MSRRLIVIIIIGAIALTWGLLDGPAARQRRGGAAAHSLAEKLKTEIANDPRYASITFRISTQPKLIVHGEVQDVKALNDLKSIIKLPPDAEYSLGFSVKITDAPTTGPND